MLSKNKIVQIKLRNMVKLNKYQMKVVFRLDLDKIQYTVKLVWKRLLKKKQGYVFSLFQKNCLRLLEASLPFLNNTISLDFCINQPIFM